MPGLTPSTRKLAVAAAGAVVLLVLRAFEVEWRELEALLTAYAVWRVPNEPE